MNKQIKYFSIVRILFLLLVVFATTLQSAQPPMVLGLADANDQKPLADLADVLNRPENVANPSANTETSMRTIRIAAEYELSSDGHFLSGYCNSRN
ncbi:MAG: hypothetical protein ACJAUP_003738 [Cellvibrionaceae bacterium]|jgi:hypothetical protein